jgi:hydrogenase maturation protease
MRILVAGIGNIFLGDDAFGCEVARILSQRSLPEGVRVRDFGIRSLDLAYAMMEDYDAVILVDASPRGDAPGTLYLINLINKNILDEHRMRS